MEGDSLEHCNYFIEKIKRNEHFGLIRPADGELQVLQNNTLTNIDNWTFKSNGILRTHLFNAIHSDLNDLYVGIPCPHCSIENYMFYKNNFPSIKKTYATVFINKSWKTFVEFLKNYEKGFCIVTCGKENPKEFNVLSKYEIDDYLVNNWDTKYNEETDRLIKYVSAKENTLILFSAGPLTKIWIPFLMNLYPNNTYLDIGSSLDIFFKGSTNRHYTYDDEYSKVPCSFNSS